MALTEPTLFQIMDEFMKWMGEHPNITPEDIGVVMQVEQTPHGPLMVFTPESVINSRFYEFSGITPPKEIVN